jgi:hypothetical protein
MDEFKSFERPAGPGGVAEPRAPAQAADRGDGRKRVRVRSRHRRPWWQRRRARRTALTVGAVALLALGADAALAARAAVRGLTSARDHLEQGAADLVAGRVDRAENAFALAAEAGGEASGATHHPAALVVGLVPGLSDDVRAVRALGESSVLLGDAGVHLARAARLTGWNGEGIPGLRAGGVVDVEVLRRAEPQLNGADSRFGRASELLDAVPTDGLGRRLGEAVVQARQEVQEQGRLLTGGAELARILPSFLGADGPRQYFLAIQNLSAPRGSGGYLGHYGILRADRGRIDLDRLAPVGSLGRVPQVPVPPDVDARYARFGGATHFIAANYSPDFPTTAQVLTQLWEWKTGEVLDGVIAVDSVWMSYVLEAIGPLRTSAWPEPLTAENIDQVLGRDTFLLPQRESNRVQGAIGGALWRALLERPPPARGMGAAMARAVRERHLQAYSRHQQEQEGLEELGATGRLGIGPNPLMVVWQDAVSSRTGYFARKSVTHRIRLEPDRSATVTTEITLENQAPDRPPSTLLGSGTDGDPVGYFTAFVNVYTPKGAADLRSNVEGGLSLGLIEEEFGRPVLLELLGAQSKQTATMRVSYRAPDAVVPTDNGFVYELTILPQPALRPDRVRIEVVAPEGMILEPAPGPFSEEVRLEVGGRSLTFEGTPTEAGTLTIRLLPEGP